jgi:hypothetical protein
MAKRKVERRWASAPVGRGGALTPSTPMSAEFIHKSYVAHDGDDAPSLEEVEARLDEAAKAGIPAHWGKDPDWEKAKPRRRKGAKREG